MFTNILYATDGSEHARKALAYARYLAELHNANVLVVHAYPSTSDVLGWPEYERLLQPRIEIGTKTLDEAAAELEASGIKVEKELLEGPMAESILKVADARNCDLIIMGARGLSDLQGLLLGSVSHRVIQHAKCPVLVVR